MPNRLDLQSDVLFCSEMSGFQVPSKILTKCVDFGQQVHLKSKHKDVQFSDESDTQCIGVTNINYWCRNINFRALILQVMYRFFTEV